MRRVWRYHLAAERGSMLIEVLVGAMLVAIASVAILDGLDGAQRTGAKNKVRSVQSTLAQQDLERLRSIPINALSNLRQSRAVNVAGVDYTVDSRTDWVRDASGVVTCSSDDTQANYLKLSTTVTSPASTGSPVTETGLLTPALGQLSETAGTATVKLIDRDGQPLVGVAVTLSGPASLSDRTNELGCAVFGYIASGTYTIEVPGLVEPASVTPASKPMDVYAGKASLAQMQVDRPASVRANFVAPAGQGPPALIGWDPDAMKWDSITVKNANLPGTTKTFSSGVASSVDATDLFPFADGIGVYAGSCAANDPSAYQPNYFQPGGRGYTALDPGDTLRSAQVEMPTLRVIVLRTIPSPVFDHAEVKVTPLDSGCSTTYTASADFAVKTSHNFDLAVPFGRYDVCVSTSNGAGSERRIIVPNRDLTTVPPTANRLLPAPTGTTPGSCLP
jgi:type II secretory pathway pseudopilin PulG